MFALLPMQVKAFIALGVAIALAAALAFFHHKWYQEGWQDEHNAWAAADAAAAIHAATVTNNSAANLEEENAQLKTALANLGGYYTNHPVPGVQYVRGVCHGQQSANGLPQVSDPTGQPDGQGSDPVSNTEYVVSTDYEKLANDCLATTLMLTNAQEWAARQREIFTGR